jgi:hypothetical protein
MDLKKTILRTVLFGCGFSPANPSYLTPFKCKATSMTFIMTDGVSKTDTVKLLSKKPKTERKHRSPLSQKSKKLEVAYTLQMSAKAESATINSAI